VHELAPVLVRKSGEIEDAPQCRQSEQQRDESERKAPAMKECGEMCHAAELS